MSAWQGQQHNQQYQQPWQPPQQSRSSWQDPRFANQNSFSANSPVAHTPLSPVQAYNVNNVPGTANWGVRFNQTQQPGHSGEHKPPLPPRPASGLAHAHSPAPFPNVPSWQAPAWANSMQQTQSGFSHDLGHAAGQEWPPGSFPNQQEHSVSHFEPTHHSPAPPMPPPRPSAYQSQAQLGQSQWPHQQHSHHTTSYSQDPQNQGQPFDFQQTYQSQQPYQEPRPVPDRAPSVSQAQTVQVDERPPVSPEVNHVLPFNSTSQARTSGQNSRIEPGSSALGTGGPSDWEYFQASAGDLEDEGRNTSSMNGLSQWDNPVLKDTYAELPAHFSRTASKRESSQQGSTQLLEPTSPVPKMSEVCVRERSVSPEPSEGLRRTGTIDGVIQAWSTPLGSRNALEESRKSSVSTLDRSRRDGPDSIKSSPRQVFQNPQAHENQAKALEHGSPVQMDQEQPASPSRVPVRQYSLAPPPLSTKTIEVDPYADLGPEYRASLARYATMLRKEEGALDEEKYKIFKAFVVKETRLRSILYNVEDDGSDVATPPRIRTKQTDNGSTVAEVTPTKVASPSSSLPVRENSYKAPNITNDLSSKLTIDTAPAPNDDSYVVVERDNQSEYSPGGRPRMTRTVPSRTASHPVPKLSPKATSSPSDYAPIVVDELLPSSGNVGSDSARNAPPEPGTAPLAGRGSVINDPIKFEPPRPAYTPFRYAEGPQKGSEPSIIARPAYQAYSALRNQSVESGRIMAQSTVNSISPTRRETLTSPTVGNVRREHEEAFIGLIREKTRASRGGKPGKSPFASVNDLVPLPNPADRPAQAITDLREIIPTSMPQKRRPSPQMVESKQIMGQYPDVFTWIPEIVVTWDRENRVVRKKQEEERQARQEESEKDIDALFNEHEIGYSDIGRLESDFKLAEATRRYDEDVQELDSFTERVFKPVTERLKEELVQLNAQYVRGVDVLELEADSGNHYIHGKSDRASRSEAMENILTLYNKLQIRHVKTAEAHYERERRRKKLELSVLYTNGDTAAMKRLEQEFTKAERQQALHQAREKDSRANKLMDTFDRATVQGLGENQQFTDDVVAKLRSVDDLLKEKQENVTELLRAGLHETLQTTEELLDYVANDSKTLLNISNKADNMLNEADYDVSVAEARVANATQESMKTLEEEKRKEDERIKAEVDTRMGSVAKAPESALSLLRNIMKRSGDDPQHQDRVQKALEAAKLRNASKTPV